MNDKGNIYFQSRKAAAEHDDRLNSREGAAELLGISPSQLANYELNITKFIPVESVLLMADLYHAPELRAHYCKNTCPLGAEKAICTGTGSIESIAVRMACMSKRGILDAITGKLLEIAQDAHVSEQEKDELKKMAESLSGLELLIQEMRMKAEERA
jgi:transcriptional regulator with XRE-family HTH domain